MRAWKQIIREARAFTSYSHLSSTDSSDNMGELQRLPGFNVANHYEKRALLIAVNSIAALSIFFFGYDQGMMGGVNTAKDYVRKMGFGYVDDATGEVVTTNALLKGGIVSVYYLGTLFGCLLGGWVGDKVGRIRTIALGALWAILGASLQCSSQNHQWMICGKLVTVHRQQGIWGANVTNL